MLDVINAKYIKDYMLEIEFSNSTKGIVDLKEYTTREGLFKSIADIKFFKKFNINRDIGTICWENGLDIAPDTLYNKIINT